MKRCYNCFESCSPEAEVCPKCGERLSDQPKVPIYLKPGTVLANRYIIGHSIGQGGFGIIYRAWDNKFGNIVAIKEFYISRIMMRAEGEKNIIVSPKEQEQYAYRKARFLSEARSMAKFGTQRWIPNVFEFFEENNTAYIVMELLIGESLNEYIKAHQKVELDLAVHIINEVGSALTALHKEKIIHRDIAPDNIYLCDTADLRVKTLDLGGAKLGDSTDKVIDIITKPGYSPVEQYDKEGNIGPWTDVYALGATLYCMLTGFKPDESTNRKKEDKVIPPAELDTSIPVNISNAIMKALAVEPHLRFRTVSEFLKAVNGEKKVGTIKQEKRRRNTRRWMSVLAVFLLLAAAGGFLYYQYQEKYQESLNDASISIWYSVTDDSTEKEAMDAVIADFTSKFPNVTVEATPIPEEEYISTLEEALAAGSLPTLFESTGVPEEILASAADISDILTTEQAQSCLFLNQYDEYYSEYKQIPLAIEVPVAYVITNGPAAIEYDQSFFTDLSAFSSAKKIVEDPLYQELIDANFPSSAYLAKREAFLDNEENTAPVMLSSSMILEEVRETLTNYTKTYVYPDSDQIVCGFLYEWSIGSGNKDEVAAAKRLLTWMLGNVYQNTLMISMCSEGQIPINEACFMEKTEQTYLKPLQEIYTKFIMKQYSKAVEK